ncbi:MAG: cysteine desulfurase family protein [Verrucomicrobiota bacterium]
MIYLDHNATTPVLPEVVEAMLPWLTSHWGNPSSIYGPGRLAKRAVEAAREQVAHLVGANPEQVIFTSGATEANNSAIHSSIFRDSSRRHLITSAVEHSAVLGYCDYLERTHGVAVTRLPVNRHGAIATADLIAALRPETALVSLMWANNETGVIWPIAEYASICAAAGVAFHTDAVQAIGKIPVHFGECGSSLLSLSGHKFGAPKGIGALVIAEPDNFVPLIYGGKQECGMRGGTESVPLIVALGAATISSKRGTDCWNEIGQLRDEFETSLIERIPSAMINGCESARLPNTSNIHLPGLDGDALVTFLDQQGICVSSGSACLESAITASHVIQAMTGSHERASESIRISLNHRTTSEELKSMLLSLTHFVELAG